MSERHDPPIPRRITIDLDDLQLRDPKIREAVQQLVAAFAEQDAMSTCATCGASVQPVTPKMCRECEQGAAELEELLNAARIEARIEAVAVHYCREDGSIACTGNTSHDVEHWTPHPVRATCPACIERIAE